MNEKIIEEKYQKLIDYVRGLSDREKEILTDYLNSHGDDFHKHTINTLVNGIEYTMIQYITEYVTSRESLMKDDDQGKIESITDSQEQERGKAFVQPISSSFQNYKDSIQAKRDERYEEMIREAEEKYGPIESPMDRLKR